MSRHSRKHADAAPHETTYAHLPSDQAGSYGADRSVAAESDDKRNTKHRRNCFPYWCSLNDWLLGRAERGVGPAKI